MKQTFSIVLAGMMLAQSTPLFANDANVGVTALTGMNRGASNVYANSGPYDIDNKVLNTSEYVRDLLKTFKDIQASDMQYVEETIKSLLESTNEYTRLLAV